MKKLSVLVSLVLSIPALTAQTIVPGTIENINAIKIQQDSYIFAEYTGKTESEALDNVKSLLEDQIIYWASMTAGKDTPKLDNAQIIVIQRGPYFRAFAFVAKEKTSSLVETVSAEASAEGPVMGEAVPEPPSGVGPMSGIRHFDQIKPFIDGLEEKGLLIDYGKFATLPENGNCFLFIYDRSGSIVARLKRENKDIRNVDTRGLESLSDYPGCGAIWFRTFDSKLD